MCTHAAAQQPRPGNTRWHPLLNVCARRQSAFRERLRSRARATAPPQTRCAVSARLCHMGDAAGASGDGASGGAGAGRGSRLGSLASDVPSSRLGKLGLGLGVRARTHAAAGGCVANSDVASARRTRTLEAARPTYRAALQADPAAPRCRRLADRRQACPVSAPSRLDLAPLLPSAQRPLLARRRSRERRSSCRRFLRTGRARLLATWLARAAQLLRPTRWWWTSGCRR